MIYMQTRLYIQQIHIWAEMLHKMCRLVLLGF